MPSNASSQNHLVMLRIVAEQGCIIFCSRLRARLTLSLLNCFLIDSESLDAGILWRQVVWSSWLAPSVAEGLRHFLCARCPPRLQVWLLSLYCFCIGWTVLSGQKNYIANIISHTLNTDLKEMCSQFILDYTNVISHTLYQVRKKLNKLYGLYRRFSKASYTISKQFGHNK